MKKKEKNILIVFFIFLILFFLAKDILPTNDYFFTFHDHTQTARIQQFTNELKKLHIPPRIAPDMNFGLGFPIFNFYAPTAYWITSIINLIISNPIISLKISFILSLIIMFLGNILFLKLFFNFYESLIGAIVYTSSLYIALDIFVRGNLSEIWFIAFLPWIFYFLTKNSFNNNLYKYKKNLVFSFLILFLIFTTHNIYSLLSIPIFIIYSLILNNKKINLILIFFALISSSYFFIPLFLEMKYIWGKEIAIQTIYYDHFLCISQLWKSPWGFGGSIPGCEHDSMSFQLGKPQIIFSLLGITLLLIKLIKNLYYFLKNEKNNKEKNIKFLIFFLIYTILSIFLTHHKSKFIWNIFSPYSSLIQFPWRFLGISLIGLGFFTSYFFNRLKINYKKCIILIFSILVLAINKDYFYGQKITNSDFQKKYLSEKYIKEDAAYAAQEHLPKVINYKEWLELEKNKNPKTIKNFVKKNTIKPFNKNKQTNIQKISNLISILSILIFLTILIYL